MRRPSLLAVLLCAVCAAPAQAGLRVVGGAAAPAGRYDAVARVTSSGGSCTGTLVSREWVLTAGHCASVTGSLFGTPLYFPASSYAVVLGTTRADGAGGTRLGVDAIRTPPGYVGTRSSDVALLHLTGTAPQAPVRIAGRGAGALWAPGTLETIAGFGLTSEGAAEGPQTMQVARVPIVPDATCAAAYPNDRDAPTYPDVFESVTQICAGYPQGGTDTCQGDSGGPLFGQDADGALKLVGSTSRGFGCARAGYPGVYARLADTVLREWVRGVVPDAVDDHVALTPTQKGTTGAGAPSTGTGAGAGPSAAGSGAASGGGDAAAARFAAEVATVPILRATLAREGLRVVVRCSAGCTARLVLRSAGRVVGDRTLTRRRGGTLRAHVRVRRGEGALARDRRARLSLEAVVSPLAGGRAVRATRRVAFR